MFNKVRSSDHCSWLIEQMKITCVQKELFHIHDLCPPNYNFFTIVHASPLYFLTTLVPAMEAYSDQHTCVFDMRNPNKFNEASKASWNINVT